VQEQGNAEGDSNQDGRPDRRGGSYLEQAEAFLEFDEEAAIGNDE
jgi:hypothetical protein